MTYMIRPPLLAALLVISFGVTAADTGSFDMMTIWEKHYHSMDWPDRSFTVGELEGTGTILESTAGPFVVEEYYRSSCLVYAKRTESRYVLEAHCSMRDASGDSFNLRAIRDHGNTEAGGGGEGQWEFMGGTNKYAGILRGCAYMVKYLGQERGVLPGFLGGVCL